MGPRHAWFSEPSPYDRHHLVHDLIAGLSVAAVTLPVGVAYAQLASANKVSGDGRLPCAGNRLTHWRTEVSCVDLIFGRRQSTNTPSESAKHGFHVHSMTQCALAIGATTVDDSLQ